MSAVHDKVHAFADGELTPAEADEFRAHLVECADCQAELLDIMRLVAIDAPPAKLAAVHAPDSASASPVIPLRARRRRTVITWVAAATAAAAALAFVAWRVVAPRPIVLAQAETRSIEARLSDPSADRWRPYSVDRGQSGVHEAIDDDTLTALERRGERRRLADARILGGEPARAAELLAALPPSADVDSDRAAAALQQHDAEAALRFATRAVQAAPTHGPARWNRALALRELGLPRAAAAAFAELGRDGAVGWSAEARTRAAALNAAVDERERSRRQADAAGRELLASGAATDARLARAWPSLLQHYRALRAHDAAHDPWAELAAEEHAAQAAIDAHDTARGERLARGAVDRARDVGMGGPALADALELAATAARAGGNDALADAYADEAKLERASQ